MLSARIGNDLPVVNALGEADVPEEGSEEVVVFLDVDTSSVLADCDDLLVVGIRWLRVPYEV